MNERIQELSDIAYKNHLARNPNSSFGRRSDYDREFAELIVRECMNAVCDPRTIYLESMTESSAMYAARERIRKHFGVE
jgi:hypothetical protein